MKIIKASSKSVINSKGKKIDYDKYLVNLPKKIVEESGFLNKDLAVKIEGRKIVISIKS